MHVAVSAVPVPYQAQNDVKLCRYEGLQVALQSVLQGETNWVSGMSTTASLLHYEFDYFHWTGFYQAVSHDMLSIGPYQGKIGCLRIPFSKGVCGAAASQKATVLVPDVHAFPGHIACDGSTQSEIVVPVTTPGGKLLAVLDVDSNYAAAFDDADKQGLESICRMLGEHPWSAA